MINDSNKKIVYLVTLSPKTHRTSEENLGLGYLKSSLMNEGYDVQIIDGWLNNLRVIDIYNMIMSNSKKILFVGISSYMSNTEPTIELIRMLKQQDKSLKIVCGGFGPTFYPQKYLRGGSDYIIRGEGEKIICMLANAISKGSSTTDIPNIGYIDCNDKVKLNNMMCLNNNLDSIPFPSRDTIDIIRKNKSTVNMVTSRGCSGNCDFCSVIAFFRLSDGKIWRTRSIKNIVDEIEKIYHQGFTHIKMVDDSFIDGNRDETWCKNFADEIKKRNINVKLRGQIRADKISDGILYELKRAGFFSFACGIENGSQSALSRMNKTASLNDNIKALELFKKYGYIVQMGFILFDRYTTINELVDNYYFIKKYDFAVTKGIFSEMYSAEGTVLNNKLRASGNLIEDGINQNNHYIIKDDEVRRIYDALKLWHKSHSKIYDMTIDPVIAPKSIDDNLMKKFYQCIMYLKKLDLEIFKYVLLNYKNKMCNLNKMIDEKINENQTNYNNIENYVKKLYKKANIQYNANVNPFI